MHDLNVRKLLIILAHSFVGWALCAATIGLGMSVTSLQTALIAHAVGAPLVFFGVSVIYFTRFHYTGPLPTAVIFVAFVMVVDFFVMAMLILRSLDMFASLLGTWIPFALIFASTLMTGHLVERRSTAARLA